MIYIIAFITIAIYTYLLFTDKNSKLIYLTIIIATLFSPLLSPIFLLFGIGILDIAAKETKIKKD